MAAPEPLSPFRVTLPCGVFNVQARSLQAAVLRAQADALDAGVLDSILAPQEVQGEGFKAAAAPIAIGTVSAGTPLDAGGAEPALTAQEVQCRLAHVRGHTVMHHTTLIKAIRRNGLPCHENPFGRGWIFYWSEVQEWLKSPGGQTATGKRLPTKRGLGQPNPNT